MKKLFFKKITTFSAVIALTISLLPVQTLSNAVKADEGVQQYISSSNEEPLFDLTNEKRESVLPYYFDEDYDGYYEIPGKGEAPVVDPSISYAEARGQLVNNPFSNLRGRIDNSYDFNVPKAYPAAYNDTDNLYAYLKNELTPLRNQGTEGCCWAVSTLGAVENYILTNGKKDLNGSASVKATDLIPGINYSEIQLAYFYYHNNIFNNLPEDHIQNDDVLEYYSDEAFTDIGGNYFFASQILTNGIGTVDESVIPYNTVDSFRTADQKSAKTGIDDEFMVNNDVAHVNNAYYMNIHQNANQVKQAIKQNHAVSVSIRAERKYYNSDYNTYYYSKRTSSINHAVCIVGWDDSFPKEYFIGSDGNGTTPTRDGAWLARNSWMDTLGPFDKDVFDFNGYFWISYEDNSLASFAFVFEADTSEDYDNVYSYNSNIHQTESFINTYTVANVFKVNGEKAAEQECIYAVTLEIENENMDYEIYVYSVDEEGNPNEAISEPTTGRMVFPGIYTIPLSDPVVLQRGEEYAIVVTTGNYSVCIESCIDFKDAFSIKVGKNKGESFVFDDGITAAERDGPRRIFVNRGLGGETVAA